MINYNENVVENGKKIDHIDKTQTDLGQDMDTNILNINVSQYDDGYVQ